MADKAISELVAAEQIKSTDMFVLEQDGTAKRLQGQTLLNWLTAAADGHGGISNIVKTGTDGLVDTYTITLADTTTKTFTVTNGNGLTEFGKLSTVGLVDTYQFTRSDGTYFTFAVSNGAKGDTGDASHVWIKYASQQPTVNSHSIGDNPDDWMGVYSGTAETAPTDWQAYSWYQIKGDKGDTGAPATVTGVTAEYIVSDSGTIVPSGSWSTTIPSVPQGKYLWTRSTTNFNTGDPAVSYSVTRMGIDGIGSVSSVNDKSPSDSGNVTLTAGDIQASGNASVQEELDNAVKYNTPQPLTPEQQAQARDNINAPAPYEAGDNISITGRIITTKAFPCNPKLTDNWYWGNPVDQRKGIIPKNTSVKVYYDVECTNYAGPVNYYPSLFRESNGNFRYDISDTVHYYIKAEDTMRGYGMAGYTIDRWKMDIDIGTVTIENDGVVLESGSSGITWFEPQDEKLTQNLKGKTLTWSVMYTVISQTGNSGSFGMTALGNYIPRCTLSGDVGRINVASGSAVVPENLECVSWFYLPVGCKIKLHAVGLELGSQQTLAHQEYGEWVLNEIPKFGDQLAECQRYYYRPYHVLLWRTPGTNSLTVDANFKVDMRSIPAAIYTNPLTVLVPGKTANGHISLSNLVVNVGGVGNCDLTSVDPSDAEVLQIERGQIAFSADL